MPHEIEGGGIGCTVLMGRPQDDDDMAEVRQLGDAMAIVMVAESEQRRANQ